MTNKFIEFVEYVNDKLMTIIFKFAIYSIIILTLLLLSVEVHMIGNDKKVVQNNEVQNTLALSFFLLKIFINHFLIVICVTCRTFFDLTKTPAIFERFSVSFLFLTILTIFIKIYCYDILTESYKQVLDYEIYYIPIIFGFILIAFTTWTPSKSSHFLDHSK